MESTYADTENEITRLASNQPPASLVHALLQATGRTKVDLLARRAVEDGVTTWTVTGLNNEIVVDLRAEKNDTNWIGTTHSDNGKGDSVCVCVHRCDAMHGAEFTLASASIPEPTKLQSAQIVGVWSFRFPDGAVKISTATTEGRT